MNYLDSGLPELALVSTGFGAALVGTLFFELIVAAAFKVRRRGLAAVALINLVTNPLFNLAILLLVLTAGIDAPWGWVVTASVPLLEVVVVVAEWRLLIWALNGTAGSSRKMLALSAAMNATSALGGMFFVFGLPLVISTIVRSA